MAIAFVKNVGTRSVAATSVSVTVPAAGVAAGDILWVRVTGATTTTYSTVVDTQGNTYTPVNTEQTSGNVQQRSYLARVATALVSGNTITLTTNSSMNITHVSVEQFSGASETPAQSTLATGSSTTPSVGPLTPAATGQLVLGMYGLATSDTTQNLDSDTTDGSWVALTYINASSRTNDASYKIVTGTSAQTYNVTVGSSAAWAAELIVLAAAAGPVPLGTKAATSSSAKATANVTRPLSAKAATSSSAKASLTVTAAAVAIPPLRKRMAWGKVQSNRVAAKPYFRIVTRPSLTALPLVQLAGKAATASSAKASRIVRAVGLAAKAATASSAKATARAARPLVAKAATASSAKATAKATRPISAKAGTSSSAKATAKATRPISAKAATSLSAKADLTVTSGTAHGGNFSAKAATASSAKATLGVTRPLAERAATSSSAKASLRATRPLVAKAATASSAKASLRVARPMVTKAATADNAKATTITKAPKQFAVKVGSATSAKATLRRVVGMAAKSATSSSAKATCRRAVRLTGKAATSSSAKATCRRAVGLVVTVPTASGATCTVTIIGPAGTATASIILLGDAYPGIVGVGGDATSGAVVRNDAFARLEHHGDVATADITKL